MRVHSILQFLHDGIPRDADFLIAAAALLAAGFVFARYLHARPDGRVRAARRLPIILAVMTAVMGLLDIASAATPRIAGRLAILERISPLELRHAGHFLTLAAGLVLLYLARGLARRKRAAWALATSALFVSAAAHLVKGLDWEEASAALALAGIFIVLRPSFHADSDPYSIRQGLRLAASTALVLPAVGAAGFRALAAHRGLDLSPAAALQATLTALNGGDPFPGAAVGRLERFFPEALAGVAYLAGAAVTVLLLRPVLAAPRASPEETRRAWGVVSRWGSSALDRYALFDDKRYTFSPAGSLVAFAPAGRWAVALRGPIGPADDRTDAVRLFLDLCARNDWDPCVYQAPESLLPDLEAAGLPSVLRIGQEAIVDLEGFTLAGKRSQDLRTALNRIGREGGRVEVHSPPHPEGLVASLRGISDEWIAARHGVEQRFALGRFDPSYLAGCVLAVLYDSGGRPAAFANLLPEFSSGGIALDLMRHSSGSARGAMDAVLAGALAWAKEAGYTTFNLGLGAFASVGEHPEDPPLEKAIATVIPVLERFYGFGGLESFKRKFGPRWEPRYLVCRTPAARVPALFAVARAHLGARILPFTAAALFRLPRPERLPAPTAPESGIF